ncbi:MAG: flagellar filament capping protein FliD, partial [Acetanaerobacterium sp.]
PRIQLSETANGVAFSTNGSSKLAISGDKAVLASVGLTSGISNRVEITKALKDTSFANALVGDSYEFSINGVDFSFSGSSSVMNVINTINSSKAGARITYSEIEDTFTLSATTMGTGDNITIDQTKGNLLSSMLGVTASGVTEIDGGAVYTGSMASTQTDLLSTDWNALAGKSFDLTINGVTKTISLQEITDSELLTDEEKTDMAVTNLNNAIETVFKSTDVRFEVDGSTVTLVSDNNKSVSVSTIDEAGEETALLDALGFANGSSNLPADDVAFAAVGITSGGTVTLGTGANTVTVNYTENTTEEEFVQAINADTATTGISATFTDGKLTLQTDGSTPFVFSDDGGAMERLVGSSEFDSSVSAEIETLGTNAVITMADGSVLERNSNSFAVNGVILQINEKTDEPMTVSSTQDMDKVVGTVKSFAEEYNKIVTLVKGKLTEAAYSDYPPLTDEQRASMSESQINIWEEKAKSGIVKNDALLNQMLLDFDDLLIAGADDSIYSLTDLGFDFNTSITEGTKLEFNEEKFRSALSEDHAGVTTFFTAGKTGLADKFAAMIDHYSYSSLVDPGLLVQVSGTESYVDSQQSKQIAELDEKITDLKNSLTAQETRLWKQFSAMESALSSLNSQSSWLSSMFNTGS